MAGVRDDVDRSLTDLLTDAAAAHEDSASLLQRVVLLDVHFLLRLHGLGPRLHDPEFTRVTVLGPFHVHWGEDAALLRVVLFDDAGPARQGQNLVVRDREPCAVFRRDRHVASHASAADVVDQLELLAAKPFLQDRPEALGQRRFKHEVFVGVHRPLHDVLTQPVRGVDENRVAEARLSVDREHHARGRQVRTDHALHADRQANLKVIKTLVPPVRDRPVGEQRREAAFAGLQQLRPTTHVQIGLLLPGETGVGKVFGRGTAPHGDIEAQLGIAAKNVVGVDNGAL